MYCSFQVGTATEINLLTLSKVEINWMRRRRDALMTEGMQDKQWKKITDNHTGKLVLET